MLWCALQIRAKRLYCFSSVSPFVLLCLKGVGGKQRERERGRARETKSHGEMEDES